MNNRTLTITAIVVIVLLALGYMSYITPGSPLYPGTSGASSASSDSSVSSVLPASSRNSSSAVSSDRSSVRSNSSVTSISSTASLSSSSSSFAQTTPRETVSHFYLQAASYNGDVIADIAANSPFLTAGFRSSLTNDAQLFCNERQPVNFSTTLVSRTDTDATVQVNERYLTGNVAVTISVINDNGTWRIDGVTCGASSSASSL